MPSVISLGGRLCSVLGCALFLHQLEEALCLWAPLPPGASPGAILLVRLRDLLYPVVTAQPDTPPAASTGRGASKPHHRNAAVVSSRPDPARRQLSSSCPDCDIPRLGLHPRKHAALKKGWDLSPYL